MGPYPRAVILASGRGSRLGAWGEVLPKCLLPVFDRPLLLHQLAHCARPASPRPWSSGAAQLALALAASRLPDELACTIHQRLKRALVLDLQPLWHIDAERLDQLLASLVSDDIARDLIRNAATADIAS